MKEKLARWLTTRREWLRGWATGWPPKRETRGTWALRSFHERNRTETSDRGRTPEELWAPAPPLEEWRHRCGQE